MPDGEGKQAPSTTAEQPSKGPWLPVGISGSATDEEGGGETTTLAVQVRMLGMFTSCRRNTKNICTRYHEGSVWHFCKSKLWKGKKF